MKIAFRVIFVFIVIVFTGCKKFLDRPPLTSETDATAWTSEEKLRLYTNQYYSEFFTGYGNGFTTAGAPLVGFTNSDDMVVQGNQPNFTRAVPNSMPTTGVWSRSSYGVIRSLNIMLDRVETRMSDVLTPAAKAHWLGVGRFFRAFRYSQLVQSYGDVPYYTREVFDNELDELYKPRTPRNEVMDAVYDDLKFAMQNVRSADGEQNVNRFIVAGFASRLALTEGTWQKYYYKNNAQAEKFLKLAIEAAELVMAASGTYDITSDYKSLFTSKDLKGNKEVILFRQYDAAADITHSIASNGNLEASTTNGPTSDLLKSYILTNGQVWQNPGTVNPSFSLDNMIVTRDSRFEATFYSKPSFLNKGSYYYITKFLPREVEKMKEDQRPIPAEFTGDRNDTDAPVLRYAEVLLNWIEAKAELANLGIGAVTQPDIEKSINKIRNRPLAAEAIARGVTKTAPLDLGAIPNDPSRDPEVPALLWEIRRERRMEFAFETFRLADLRRWSKLEYMDNNLNTDLITGGWVNFQTQLTPNQLTPANVGKLAVVKENGTEIVYNGTNPAAMVGFYKNTANQGRLPFLNQGNINPYLTPVGLVEMNDYASRGYKLQQTEGWPQN